MRVFRITGLAAAMAALLLTTAPAAAHERPRGEHRERPATLTLQAAASSEVMQDSVVITLATELEAADQAEAASRLTEQLNKTLEQAGKPDGIRVRNGAWRVWPSTDRDGRITAWRGRAEVVLESRDIAAAAALAGRLAPMMAIASVSFDLSPEARAAEEQRLLHEAADAFRQRAADAAKAFGFEGYRIRSLNLSGDGLMVMPKAEGLMMMRAAAATADAAPPRLEPGETTVSLSVQGEVALRPSPAPARRQ
ncbi:MAG: SIMPL domain-containing protein [Pigmentiphaga sp.]|nr:SIMPL domain-containing protein [Pigmentiphaga sp.]